MQEFIDFELCNCNPIFGWKGTWGNFMQIGLPKPMQKPKQFMQGQPLGSTGCKEELQATKEHKMKMQKHRQPLQQTIPTKTLYKTQGYAHQKLQAQQKHTTLDPCMHKKATQHNSTTRKTNNTHLQQAKVAFTMHRAQPNAQHNAQAKAQPRTQHRAQAKAQPSRAQAKAQARPQPRAQPRTQPSTQHRAQHRAQARPGHRPDHRPGHIPTHMPHHNQPRHNPGHNTGHNPGHNTGHSPRHSPGHNPGHNTEPSTEPSPGHSPGHNTGHSPWHNPRHRPQHRAETKQKHQHNTAIHNFNRIL